MCCSSKDAFKGVCGGGLIHTAQTAKCMIQPRRWAAGSSHAFFTGHNGSFVERWRIKGTATDAGTTSAIVANTWITERWRVCEKQVKVGFFFHAVLLGWYGKYATSVSRARLTALSVSIAHACTLCLYWAIIEINQRAALLIFSFPSVSIFNCYLFIIMLLPYWNLSFIQSHHFRNRRKIQTDMGENTSSCALLNLSASSWHELAWLPS